MISTDLSLSNLRIQLVSFYFPKGYCDPIFMSYCNHGNLGFPKEC